MNVIATDHQAVLEAFLAFIKAELSSQFNDTNIWLSDDPHYDIPPAAKHKLYGCVCPTDGQNNGAEFAGSGAHNLVEYTAATVVIHSVMRLQQTAKPAIVMFDPTNGLFVVKRLLMRALHGVYLTTAGQPNRSLLTQPMEFIHAERPIINGQPVGDLAMTFSLPFLWDL